jgi:hypothetical protein
MLMITMKSTKEVDMAVIDQSRTWVKVEERLKIESDPLLRHNLELLLSHMQAEAAGDVPGLMSTVAESAVYETYGQDPSTWPRGKPAVRQFYETFADSGAQKLQLEIDYLVVDRHCIVTDGTMRMAWPGTTLRALGIDVDDPDSDYLFETRMSTTWPVTDDGLFNGENTYVGGDGFAGIADRKLKRGDVIMYEPN